MSETATFDCVNCGIRSSTKHSQRCIVCKELNNA